MSLGVSFIGSIAQKQQVLNGQSYKWHMIYSLWECWFININLTGSQEFSALDTQPLFSWPFLLILCPQQSKLLMRSEVFSAVSTCWFDWIRNFCEISGPNIFPCVEILSLPLFWTYIIFLTYLASSVKLIQLFNKLQTEQATL